MSDQTKFMKSLIDSAKSGNDAAVTLLREIVKGCADKAPDRELVGIAEYVYHLGVQAGKDQIEKN